MSLSETTGPVQLLILTRQSLTFVVGESSKKLSLKAVIYQTLRGEELFCQTIEKPGPDTTWNMIDGFSLNILIPFL